MKILSFRKGQSAPANRGAEKQADRVGESMIVVLENGTTLIKLCRKNETNFSRNGCGHMLKTLGVGPS